MVNGPLWKKWRSEILKGKLYFITTLDTTGTQSSYKLQSLVGGQAIFNNDNQAFPNQVILQQNDPDEFTTILQNAGPSNMSSSQADYLRNRNYIQQEQAVRIYREFGINLIA